MLYNAPKSIINDNLSREFDTYKSVILFGTGNLGKIALHSIEKTGINIQAVADNDNSKWGNENTRRKNRVCKLSENHEFFCAAVMLLNKKFYYKTKDVWESILDYWKDKTTQCDQTIQNILVGKYYGKYNVLDADWGAWYKKGKFIAHYEHGRRNDNTIKNFEKYENKLLTNTP